MGPNQTLVDNLLRILPYVEDEETDAMARGMGMAEIREKLAALQNPVPGDKQIRRTLLKLDSVGSFGATRGKLWYRTLQRTDFRIRNMNANMAMAMCALKQVADRHLPAVAKAHGFTYLDHDAMVFPESGLAVVGTMNWYDYTWDIDLLRAAAPDWEERLRTKRFTRGPIHDFHLLYPLAVPPAPGVYTVTIEVRDDTGRRAARSEAVRFDVAGP